MKIPDFLKKTATAVLAPSPDSRQEAHREMAAKRAEWERQWAEAQREYRATRPPGTRVPGPRQLGLPWPPPPAPPNPTIPTPHEIWSEDQ